MKNPFTFDFTGFLFFTAFLGDVFDFLKRMIAFIMDNGSFFSVISSKEIKVKNFKNCFSDFFLGLGQEWALMDRQTDTHTYGQTDFSRKILF